MTRASNPDIRRKMELSVPEVGGMSCEHPKKDPRAAQSRVLTDEEMVELIWEQKAKIPIHKESVRGHLQYACGECGLQKSPETFLKTHSPAECCMLAALKTNGFKLRPQDLSVAAALPKNVTWRKEINAVLADSQVSS
jgi:hypothetical protein